VQLLGSIFRGLGSGSGAEQERRSDGTAWVMLLNRVQRQTVCANRAREKLERVLRRWWERGLKSGRMKLAATMGRAGDQASL